MTVKFGVWIGEDGGAINRKERTWGRVCFVRSGLEGDDD
jgi:hypothetical protein